MVAVQRTRMESRARKVPVTKTREEVRTRTVPVTRTRTEIRKVPFPLAGARFTKVSGEEVSLSDMKTKAKEDITILTLPAGEKLSDFHRSVLKPELIVMFYTDAPESDGAEEETEEEK